MKIFDIGEIQILNRKMNLNVSQSVLINFNQYFIHTNETNDSSCEKSKI